MSCKFDLVGLVGLKFVGKPPLTYFCARHHTMLSRTVARIGLLRAVGSTVGMMGTSGTVGAPMVGAAVAFSTSGRVWSKEKEGGGGGVKKAKGGKKGGNNTNSSGGSSGSKSKKTGGGVQRPGSGGILRGVPREIIREEPKMRYAGYDNPNTREFTPYPYQHIMRVDRVVNVTKGGRRQSFRALVVVGNMRGSAGYGSGKGNDVKSAIKRAFSDAARKVIYVDMYNGRTLNHECYYKHGGSKVLLRPQRKDGPYRAGRPYLPVMEAFGFKELSIKIHGSRNMINVVKAIWNALARHRSAEDVARARGKTIVDISGRDPRKQRLDPNAHFYED